MKPPAKEPQELTPPKPKVVAVVSDSSGQKREIKAIPIGGPPSDSKSSTQRSKDDSHLQAKSYISQKQTMSSNTIKVVAG